jgi:RimJ/RimL family protein N-acetyltransferase
MPRGYDRFGNRVARRRNRHDNACVPRETTIRTARLIIRRFAPADLEDFLSYQDDPVVRRFIPGEPMSTEQAVDYLAAQAVLDEHELDSWHASAVQHVATGRVIGDIGIWLPGQPERVGTGDVGFQFHPDFHGQGYAREAMLAYLAYVFETLELPRITAGCDVPNKQSWGLMERLGMHPLEKNDKTVQYGLTREQWAAGAQA